MTRDTRLSCRRPSVGGDLGDCLSSPSPLWHGVDIGQVLVSTPDITLHHHTLTGRPEINITSLYDLPSFFSSSSSTCCPCLPTSCSPPPTPPSPYTHIPSAFTRLLLHFVMPLTILSPLLRAPLPPPLPPTLFSPSFSPPHPCSHPYSFKTLIFSTSPLTYPAIRSLLLPLCLVPSSSQLLSLFFFHISSASSSIFFLSR